MVGEVQGFLGADGRTEPAPPRIMAWLCMWTGGCGCWRLEDQR